MEEVVNNNFDDLLDPSNVTNPIEDFSSSDDTDSSQTDDNTEGDAIPDYSGNSLYQYLQSRGISDPSKVQFTNEDGTTEEVDFNSLSDEEQLEILKEVSDPGLSPEEIQTVNYFYI